ncbi:winged helix-turn-helix domain-containing protein [Arthrobacter sp. RIT-PI-e]|uniref:winged helix-turn-helix domain-containing protein n=1 Tax=Arthrobacter sp. RIT-PI-e TaxID=1681197 RepID=UPI001364A8E8|nr:winged helix-turn-helix domain-containing protein [Arthrobacter sp. RIT-PI-e]
MSECDDDRARSRSNPLEHVETMVDTLRQLRQLTDRGYREHRDAMHLNDKDMAALEYLSQEWKDERTVSPKDVAAHLGLTSATTTAIIDRLENEGYLQRRRATRDRRGVHLTPAPAMKDWERRHPVESLRASVIDAATHLGGEEARIVQGYLSTVLDDVRRRLT